MGMLTMIVEHASSIMNRDGMYPSNSESNSSRSTSWPIFDLAPSPWTHTRRAQTNPHVYAMPSMWFVVVFW